MLEVLITDLEAELNIQQCMKESSDEICAECNKPCICAGAYVPPDNTNIQPTLQLEFS